MKTIRTTFTASLKRTDDPSEVTLVAMAVGVGKTHRLATGQVVTWTAAFLRRKAKTFIGKPVNIDLDDEGLPTGHSRRVAGAITNAWFDEREQGVVVEAALWPHYLPSTVSRIKELGASGGLQVSMELIPEGEMIANDDGSVTPTEGDFSGLGIVRVGADPRNKVMLVAALAEDAGEESTPLKIDEILGQVQERFGLETVKTPEEQRDEHNAELAAAHEGSFEWLGRRLAEHLSSMRSPEDYTYSYVIATFPKYAIYQEGESYYRIEYARKGRDITFGDPVEVDPTYTPVEASASEDEDADTSTHKEAMLPTDEELRASIREAVMAELKPQLDELETIKAERDTLAAEKATAEETARKDALAAERADELDKILPVKSEEGRARRLATVRELTAEAFDALKAELAEAAKGLAGGINSDADEAHAADDEADVKPVSDDSMAKYRAEALAALGIAAKDKE